MNGWCAEAGKAIDRFLKSAREIVYDLRVLTHRFDRDWIVSRKFVEPLNSLVHFAKIGEDRTGVQLFVVPRRAVRGTIAVEPNLTTRQIGDSPIFEIGPEIRDGRLARVLDDWTIGLVPIHAVHPANKNIASKVRRFTHFLVKRVPKDAIA